MVKKTRVVVFTPTNARVLMNPQDVSLFKGKSNCLIDPDMTGVSGVPPHLWKIGPNNSILAMTGQEVHDRLVQIAKNGTSNGYDQDCDDDEDPHKDRMLWLWALAPVLFVALAFVLFKWWETQ